MGFVERLRVAANTGKQAVYRKFRVWGSTVPNKLLFKKIKRKRRKGEKRG